ncbi:hypothetical protein COY90_03370, partial [Candidatus Roizmanbacteria bacterium CG_4_10_14_0_8_um_filter_39_9]
MKRSESGEIATLLAIGAMIVVAVSAITSSFFVNQKQSTSTRAAASVYTGCEFSKSDCSDNPSVAALCVSPVSSYCIACPGHADEGYKCKLKPIGATVPSLTPKPTATANLPTGGVGSNGKYKTSDPGYDPSGCNAKPSYVFNCCTKEGIFTGCYASPCNGSKVNPNLDTNQYQSCLGLQPPTAAPTSGINGKPMVNGEINGCCFLFDKNSECGGGPMLAYWGDGMRCIASSGLGSVSYQGPCNAYVFEGRMPGIGLTIGQKVCLSSGSGPTTTPAIPPTAIPATPVPGGANPTAVPTLPPANTMLKTFSDGAYVC